jgi:hypothetical protein
MARLRISECLVAGAREWRDDTVKRVDASVRDNNLQFENIDQIPDQGLGVFRCCWRCGS